MLLDQKVRIFNEEAIQTTETQLAQWQSEEMVPAMAPSLVSLDGYHDGRLKSDVVTVMSLVLTTWSPVPDLGEWKKDAAVRRGLVGLRGLRRAATA
jgi:hypothetical protein